MATEPEGRIVDSWHRNAAPWESAVRGGEIESRRLVTDAAILDAILQHAAGAPGRTALDVGCGEGWLSRALAERGFATTGVDVVPSLVQVARDAHPQGDYRVVSYDEAADGALDGEYDVVVANFSLLGDESVTGLVRRLPRILALGGTFLVQTLHPWAARGELPYAEGWREGSWRGFSSAFSDPAPWYYRTIGSWVSLLAHAGLRIVDLREPLHPSTGTPASLILAARHD